MSIWPWRKPKPKPDYALAVEVDQALDRFERAVWSASREAANHADDRSHPDREITRKEWFDAERDLKRLIALTRRSTR